MMAREKKEPRKCLRGKKGEIKIFRSSRPEVFCKKSGLRNFAKFTGKHLCQSIFFNKVERGLFFQEGSLL